VLCSDIHQKAGVSNEIREARQPDSGKAESKKQIVFAKSGMEKVKKRSCQAVWSALHEMWDNTKRSKKDAR
jgi:hypothetical protein